MLKCEPNVTPLVYACSVLIEFFSKGGMEQMGKKSNNLPKEQNYKNSADGENSIRKKYKIRNVAIRIQV